MKLSVVVVSIFVAGLIATGCTRQPISSPPIPSDTAKASTVIPSEVTFSANFIMPSTFREIRSMNDDVSSPDAVYRLYEYSVTDSLASLNAWLRSEAARLGGKVTERYGYENGDRVELIIQLPAETGSRFISTYTPKYRNDQHLVVIETSFKHSAGITKDTEDHALVLVVPQPAGGTREIFLGNYEHQHTDIYSAYFFSNAFFKQLLEDGKYDKLSSEPDYTVGYFDPDGKEIYPADLDTSNISQYKFGANLNRKFLPKDGLAMKTLLASWAQTVMTGNKAVSQAYDGSETFYFFENGRPFAAYRLSDLLGSIK